MTLYYVTGLSGTGKSSVLRELRARGCHARGVDEDGYADWINRISGRADPFPGLPGFRRDDHRRDEAAARRGGRSPRQRARSQARGLTGRPTIGRLAVWNHVPGKEEMAEKALT